MVPDLSGLHDRSTGVQSSPAPVGDRRLSSFFRSAELNATEILFLGINLRLVYQIGAHAN
jgi:hypothetical protein